MSFKLGEVVEWFTPCPGNKLQAHKGTVIEVVPAGGFPNVTWLATPRNHESYLMREGKETFWPRVKWLRKSFQNLESG